jgi:hypothetical protein
MKTFWNHLVLLFSVFVTLEALNLNEILIVGNLINAFVI